MIVDSNPQGSAESPTTFARLKVIISIISNSLKEYNRILTKL